MIHGWLTNNFLYGKIQPADQDKYEDYVNALAENDQISQKILEKTQIIFEHRSKWFLLGL